ncbi:hypothetical protein [Wukongibacter sp. M2B1]|uniref:hypothetical protein n=1 Tax=Wukongibacter sp. M2B1 TaxID=3088895 RepID=UPI003D7A437D
MPQKNARQNVQDVCNQLNTCKNNLTQAISTVEKQENRQKIQSTLDAVNSALQTANNTLSTYKE